MNIALNHQGDWISASPELDTTMPSKFICPICKQAMFLKKNKLGKAYFAHYRACLSQAKQRDTNESKAHKVFKVWMMDYFQTASLSVEVEKYIPQIQQFADVSVIGGQQRWILEYQQSPISSSILKRRHRQYQSQHFKDIWVGDENLLQNHTISKWMQRLMFYHRRHGYCLVTCLPNQCKMLLRPHIPLFYHRQHLKIKRSIIAPVYLLDLNKLCDIKGTEIKVSSLNHSFTHFDRIEISKKKSTKIRGRERFICSLKLSPTYRKYLVVFYQKGIQMDALPDWVIDPGWVCLMYKEPTWFILGLIYQEVVQFPSILNDPKTWVQACRMRFDNILLAEEVFPLSDGRECIRFWLQLYPWVKMLMADGR